MRGNHDVVISRGTCSSTAAATRSLIFMLVFCFAGCAAGSCLSYGHSCWGAHGKRSGNYVNNGAQALLAEALNGEGESNVAPPHPSDQWMLSRLVAKQLQVPSSGKFRVEWRDTSKIKAFPRSWREDKAQQLENMDKLGRGRPDVVEADAENEREKEDIIDSDDDLGSRMVRIKLSMPPRREYKKHVGQTENLRLLQLLSNYNGQI